MTCVSPWTYEKKVGRGWNYNEPGLGYNDSQFDDLDIYYDSLGIATTWDSEADAPATEYAYELGNNGAYHYNEPNLAYNETIFDTFTVYYNSFGQQTEWFYEDFIDFCQPTPYLFMDGEPFLYQDGTAFEFN